MKTKVVELTYREVLDAVVALRTQEVTQTLDELSVKEKVRINKAFVAIDNGYLEYEEKRIALLKQFSEVDEDGNIVEVVSEDGVGGAKIIDQEKFEAAIADLWNEKSTFEVPVLVYGGLLNTKLSFRFLRAFEKIFIEG